MVSMYDDLRYWSGNGNHGFCVISEWETVPVTVWSEKFKYGLFQGNTLTGGNILVLNPAQLP